MTTLEIINSTANAQPEGLAILQTIKIKQQDIEGQQQSCHLLQRVINAKFDQEKLKTEGYSLQEIIDSTPGGVLTDEVHKFVLIKLQAFIRGRATKTE